MTATASLSERFARATNRLYPHLTIDAAPQLVQAAATGAVQDLRGHRYCTVVTYRPDGSPVATPVWFGLDGQTLYFRSLAHAGKVARIRGNDQVLVAACNVRGAELTAPWRGRACILPAQQTAAAEAAIQANYGGIRSGYKRAIGGADAVYIAVTPQRGERR